MTAYTYNETVALVASYEEAIADDKNYSQRTGSRGWNQHARRAVDIYNHLGYALRQNPAAIGAFKTSAKSRFINETKSFGRPEEKEALAVEMDKQGMGTTAVADCVFLRTCDDDLFAEETPSGELIVDYCISSVVCSATHSEINKRKYMSTRNL